MLKQIFKNRTPQTLTPKSEDAPSVRETSARTTPETDRLSKVSACNAQNNLGPAAASLRAPEAKPQAHQAGPHPGPPPTGTPNFGTLPASTGAPVGAAAQLVANPKYPVFLATETQRGFPILPRPPAPISSNMTDALLTRYTATAVASRPAKPLAAWEGLDLGVVLRMARAKELNLPNLPAIDVQEVANRMPLDALNVSGLLRMAHAMGQPLQGITFHGQPLTAWKTGTRQFCAFEETEKVLARVDALAGLAEVKDFFLAQSRTLKLDAVRSLQGAPDHKNLNAMFVGRAGTGKTTAALLYSGLLQSVGVLRRGHVVTATRGDLVGAVQGATAKATLAKLEQARGGVLFIDEAYSLFNGAQDAYGREAMATLIAYMDVPANRNNPVIVFAGYPDKMRDLQAGNEGFASRVADTVNFADLDNAQMLQALQYQAKDFGYGIDAAALPRLTGTIEDLRGPDFANGRSARNLLKDAVRRHEETHYEVEMAALLDGRPVTKTLALEDFTGSTAPKRVDGAAALAEIKRLDAAAGTAVSALESRIKMQKVRLEKGLLVQPLKYHAAIGGTSSTGADHIAALYAQVLTASAAGAQHSRIERIGMTDLIAGYVGQTGSNTRRVLESSQGGVIIVDNAEQLADNQFGHEALDVIVESMKRWNNRPSIVFRSDDAGMAKLIRANPELASQLGLRLQIAAPASQAASTQLQAVIAEHGFRLGDGVQIDEINRIFAQRMAAGQVENQEGFVSNAFARQDVRLASALEAAEGNAISDEALSTLERADFD